MHYLSVVWYLYHVCVCVAVCGDIDVFGCPLLNVNIVNSLIISETVTYKSTSRGGRLVRITTTKTKTPNNSN